MHKSLNQLRRELELLVAALYMPKTFWWGWPQEVMDERTTQYPLVVATPTNTTSDRDTVTVTLSIMVADKVYDNQANRYDVESDTLRILRDIQQVMYSKRWKSFAISVDQTVSATHFHKEGGDVVDGWLATFTIRLAANLDLCALPIDPEYDLDENLRPACEPVTLTINESLTLVYASGSNPSLSIVNQSGTLVGAWDGEKWVVNTGSGGDAEWTLEDTIGNVINAGSIVCGGSAVIVAPDAVVSVNETPFNNYLSGGIYDILLTDENDGEITGFFLNPTGNQISIQNTSLKINGDYLNILTPGLGDYDIDIHDTNGNDVGSIIDTVTIEIADASVSVNGTPFDTVVAEGSLNIGVENTNGAPVGAFDINTNSWVVADASVSVNGTPFDTVVAEGSLNIGVENTNGAPVGAFDINTNSWVVGDSDVNVNGNLEGSVVSVQPIDIDVTDGTNPVTPDSVSIVGNTVTIEVPPSGGGAPVGATLMKTGQTTSYRTGDDGDIEAGRDVDFFTLASNNPFGNTNRFTDELGGSAYVNDIVIDWSTYDGSTVLGWYRVRNSVNITGDDAITEALTLSIAGYTSGWRVPNVNEAFSIINFQGTSSLNYSPFNNNLGAGRNYTSTTNPANTSQLFTITANSGILSGSRTNAGTGWRYIPCRTFTVTGTTLT